MEKMDNNTTENKKTRTAAQTAVLMLILTLGSKLLGFIRETVFASCFGASYVIDSYVMAQSIPGMLVAGLLSAIATGFMPLFSDKNEKEGEEAGHKFVNDVLNLLTKISVIVAIFGIVFAPQLVIIFAKGFTGKQVTLTVFFLRVSFCYLVFSTANTLITNFLQYKNVFLPQIAFGYLQNIIVIGCAIVASLVTEKALIFGLFLSYVSINFLLKWTAKSKGFKRNINIKNTGVGKEIMLLAFPVFVGGYAASINTYVDRMLASGLVEGSVSALNYAMIIVGLVSGLTTTIISTIVFPKLNQARAQGNLEWYNEMLYKGFNLYAIITIPCAIGAVAFSTEIVQVIYERGAFNPVATSLTGIALLGYAPTLCFSQLYSHVIYAFQTNKDMKTPMFIGFATVGVNVALNLILVKRLGIIGLAIATSTATFVSLVISMIVLKKKYPHLCLIESWPKLIKIAIASVISVGLAIGTYNMLINTIWMPRVCYLACAIAVAGFSYLVELYVLKVSELALLKSIMKR